MTSQGYTVVCPDYRLVSQSIFPACIHDAKGVVRFLKANGNTYHIDPDRIGVLGNSAGSHLAAMVALSSDCPELEGDVGAVSYTHLQRDQPEERHGLRNPHGGDNQRVIRFT